MKRRNFLGLAAAGAAAAILPASASKGRRMKGRIIKITLNGRVLGVINPEPIEMMNESDLIEFLKKTKRNGQWTE